MTALLVPIALDALLVRQTGEPFAPTRMTVPDHIASTQRQQLLPDPFGADLSRPLGAYLHWSLPGGLSRSTPAGADSTPVFPAIPESWLVIRLSGDARTGPRALTAWLLPNVNASPPIQIADALGQTAPPTPAPPAPGQALTVLGKGDLAWAGYFDNVSDVLGLYDDLTGVTGAVSYLVCGWYLHPALDPMSTATDGTVYELLDGYGWSVPSVTPQGQLLPTSVVCHGAAVGLGWPTPSWPGDGGLLGVEAGGPPDPTAIGLAIADTIAEAAAALAAPGADSVGKLLVQATMAGLLSQLAQADGPATLDTVLHAGRFAAQASADNSETIWEPEIPTSPAATTPSVVDGEADADGPGLAAAIARSARLAGLPSADPHSTDDPSDGLDGGDSGSLVSADRSTPRVFAPVDPVLVLSGAGRSLVHGGDGRFSADGTLACRVSGSTVTWAGAAGTVPPDVAVVLPSGTDTQLAALAAPRDVWPLLIETAMLDPSSAPDLAAATDTAPSPDSAARAAWLADPTTATIPTVVGTLPSPVGIVGPEHPWTPMHVEWRLDWQPASAGIHAFSLGSVDFETPTAAALPATDPVQTLSGRSLLTAAPGRIAAGGAAAALAQLRRPGLLADDHPVAILLRERLQEAGADAGSGVGIEDVLAGQDLLSGSLQDFLAILRGENVNPLLRPPGSTSATGPATPTVANVVRAGLVRLDRARIVDAFGQYVDLAGSASGVPADQSRVTVGASEAIDGEPGLMALVPRFNAPARVMLRYSDASGAHADASTAISPLCGFVVPSLLDGSLEFFDDSGAGLGRLRPDDALVTVWEEDPGQPATLGRKPSAGMANPFLGAIADGLLGADTALAAAGGDGQSALAALTQLIDLTRWTTDQGGTAGDEHLAILLGHPIAVLRAGVKIDVQSAAPGNLERVTAVQTKLGTLAHTQDGLLAYFVDDDYSRVRAVDPGVGDAGDTPITSAYLHPDGSFPVQPASPVDLTLLAVPASDVHATVGLLPQKAVGMRRDWVANGLATLTPNWRYGPVLIDRKTTRIPVATDVHGSWTWHHRPQVGDWASDAIVTATAGAILPDDRVAVQNGWISLQVAPDPNFSGTPIRIGCITKPGPNRSIVGFGGLNSDGSSWWMTRAQAVAMVEAKRFSFYVQFDSGPVPVVVDQTPDGVKYLHTVSDGDPTDDLLKLPQCPQPKMNAVPVDVG